MPDKAIEVLLKEGRKFPPPKEFKRSAHVTSVRVFDRARKDPKGFWAKAAKELDWFKPWKRVLEWKCPWAKWFIGGKIKLYRTRGLNPRVRPKGRAAASPLWKPHRLCARLNRRGLH